MDLLKGVNPLLTGPVLLHLDAMGHSDAVGGNPVIGSLLDGLSGPTQRARVWRGLTQAGAVERTMAEHRAIVDAIASREPEVARSWSTVHIAGIETWLRQALGHGAGPG